MHHIIILAGPTPAATAHTVAPAGQHASVSPTMSAAAVTIAVVALVVALVQWKRKKTPKLVGWLMLVAGAGIAGGAGLAGNLLNKLGGVIGHATTVGTAKLFGVAVPAAIVVGVALWVLHDLWPKTKTPSKALPWLALTLPTMLAVAGGVWAGVGGSLLNQLGSSSADLAAAFVQGW